MGVGGLRDLRGVREALLAFAAYPTDGTETLYVNPGGVIRHQRRRRVVGVEVPPPLTLSLTDQAYLEQVLTAVRRELERLAAVSAVATAPTSWTAQIVIPFRAGLPAGTLDVDEPGSELEARHAR